MTHRCLNCYVPLFENSTDGLFCLHCTTTLNLRAAFYSVIVALDRMSKTSLEFEHGADYTEVRFEEAGSVLGVSYDQQARDYTLYIKFKGAIIFMVGQKTVTDKTVRRILQEHSPIFGNRDYE